MRPEIEALPVGEVISNTVVDASAYGDFFITITENSLDDFSVAIKGSRDVTIFQQ